MRYCLFLPKEMNFVSLGWGLNVLNTVLQDFVRLPWQNQSSQSSNAVPVGPPVSSTSVIVSRGYVPTSGQTNAGIYTSGAVSSGIGSVPQPLDITSDELETSLTQIQR